MSPGELRARAKALRAEASRLTKEAEAIEASETAARARQAHRAAIDAKAAAMCRPVWKEPRDGTWVVEGIKDGRYMLRQLDGGNRDPTEYVVSTGHPTLAEYWYTGKHTLGVLDTGATMAAWRAWCAWRKAQGTAGGS